MSAKTEALRLADALERCWPDPGVQIRSAAELRRLHAELGKVLATQHLCTSMLSGPVAYAVFRPLQPNYTEYLSKEQQDNETIKMLSDECEHLIAANAYTSHQLVEAESSLDKALKVMKTLLDATESTCPDTNVLANAKELAIKCIYDFYKLD